MMDTRTLISLLKTSTTSKSLKQGKTLHQKIITTGLQKNIVFCKTLINFYLSCHSYESAKQVFQTIENPSDITIWNGLISAYTKNHMYNEAIDMYKSLRLNPYLKPDSYTYPSVLKAFSGLRNVNEVTKIHTRLIKSGFGFDVVVASALVGLYAKCNRLDCATRLFDEMSDRDAASWNNVLSCYYQSGKYEKVLELFEEMKKSSCFEPDSVTYTTALSACARLLDLNRGREIHLEVKRSGLELDGFISSALVEMYGKCGCLMMAREVFDRIPNKSVVSWNSMISGFGLRGDVRSCLELFRRMNSENVVPTSTTISSLLIACSRHSKLQEGKFLHGYLIRNGVEIDTFISSSLMDLYFKCGRIPMAEQVFESAPKTDIITWNVMISGYVSAGSNFKALQIFGDLRSSGVRPDAVTFTSILPACSQSAALEIGKEIHQSVVENRLESSEIVMAALLDMYAKCGAIDEARKIFDELLEKDCISWTSMITAYGSHGKSAEALEIFSKMEESKVKPDGVTFLAVISACSHGGLVDEGCHYFDHMTDKYGISPTVEHYSCLIDLLGRGGRLYEAYEILDSTPTIKSDVGLLSTLFSACTMHGDIHLGEEIARQLIEKDPDDPSTYIVLSNMYASLGKWREARQVRLKMQKLGLKKSPGCSWIEVDKKIHSFLVEDISHPYSGMIFSCLADLFRHMDENESTMPQNLHLYG
ncbi:pentatricopeptide repeat-containing protein At5g27110-like [Papaver somniferum]|uniref:pentatricopeptide repeat-containing protein At5g27110-like n=1 Tax=Papaver somniferum TaxID=3469 RepID=UPI000E6F922A|nr:pentatricopeptide repeat-containing protein At5g27110-like [Papaver somniferum]XP_026400136.1 pentatricopeptide repeat-containing protein At5g27110-like [Papaver somniferum]XP_026400137.1 pentatricopeptide repeat-containing protein At5g27110-like [Papaver somniferum]XP_026400138.1 pentatricopeptide repeat-containing protein At5g27110-like [Papaver somniferum]XP_026400139.1 pentatricopeptide repeat-containing protein At5g27110-like [Papaver somniferum]XP_026400140.1 pentatricopeptide repeat-